MRTHHVYIHVPFCARRCVYCDFAIAVRSHVPVDEYVRSVERELARCVADLGPLETLYLGGGTPSRLGPEGITRLIDVVRARAAVAEGTEVTMEANPEDVSEDAARAWRRAGVNRISLGVQSFDDDVLGWMHRTHDAESAERAVHVLREAGIANVSIDLIFALPTKVRRSWSRDLERALDLDVPHLSIYGLTIEPRTPLGRWVARNDVAEAPEETFADEYMDADRSLTAAGYVHYEVSNYGRPGHESRHNWAYWRRRPYVGLGPSAHAFDGASRSWNIDAYARWADALQSEREHVAGSERLADKNSLAEEVYLGLRTSDGLAITAAEARLAARWIEEGWARLDGSSILRLTQHGWLRLDSLAAALTAFRSRS